MIAMTDHITPPVVYTKSNVYDHNDDGELCLLKGKC